MKESSSLPAREIQATSRPTQENPFADFGFRLRQLSEGFFQAGKGSGPSLTTTGEKTLKCGQESEEEIYSFDGDLTIDAPPLRTITGHGKNSEGNTECKVEFRFYSLVNNKPQVAKTDTVGRNSTPSRTGRWVKVTAKCLSSQVENPECRISWTVGP